MLTVASEEERFAWSEEQQPAHMYRRPETRPVRAWYCRRGERGRVPRFPLRSRKGTRRLQDERVAAAATAQAGMELKPAWCQHAVQAPTTWPAQEAAQQQQQQGGRRTRKQGVAASIRFRRGSSEVAKPTITHTPMTWHGPAGGAAGTKLGTRTHMGMGWLHT